MKLVDLMKDQRKLEQMKELAETGASISVIEAKMLFPPGILTKWLNKGEIEPRTIFARFRLLFRSWAAESTLTAQQQLLIKNPGKWLETSSTARVVENPKASTGIAPINSNATGTPGARPVISTEALVAAFKVLIESKNVVEDKLEVKTIDAETVNVQDNVG